MIKSPCKKVCKIVTRISNDERFCLGCGRTPYEIKKWKTASDEYKQKVLDRLKVLYENKSKESY
tara:strand:- start:14636 stop:14827 length:192 start_codon:yes stop_codon:yes gene_type:complete